jgi:hypothetical protein
MNFLRHAANVLLVVGTFVMACMVAVFAAPAMESTYFPVLRYTSVEIAGRSTDDVDLSIYGVKLRACRLLEVSALIRVKEGMWKRADIAIDSRPLQLESRPSGWQSFGVWKLRPTGDRVRLTAWHECHAGWNTFTDLGEWVIVGGKPP